MFVVFSVFVYCGLVWLELISDARCMILSTSLLFCEVTNFLGDPVGITTRWRLPMLIGFTSGLIFIACFNCWILSLNIISESYAWRLGYTFDWDMMLGSEINIGVSTVPLISTWSTENVSPWPTVPVRLHAPVVFMRVECFMFY